MTTRSAGERRKRDELLSTNCGFVDQDLTCLGCGNRPRPVGGKCHRDQRVGERRQGERRMVMRRVNDDCPEPPYRREGQRRSGSDRRARPASAADYDENARHREAAMAAVEEREGRCAKCGMTVAEHRTKSHDTHDTCFVFVAPALREQGEGTLVPPRRRVMLTLKLDADSWGDMADRLRSLARDIDIEGGMGKEGLSAGFNASYTYEASEDPSVTHDSWAAALDVYLEKLHAREQAR